MTIDGGNFAGRGLATAKGSSWETHAKWWQDTATEGADPDYDEVIFPLVRDQLAGTLSVLDIGTGEGQVARMLSGQGACVVGVDPTRAQIMGASERGGTPVYARAAAEALPFPDSCFDGVVCCLVFEHLANLELVISEIARVLANRGRLVIVLNHPLLGAPGSGWIDDQIIGEQYWRVGPYLAEDHTVEEFAPGVRLGYVHRPLSSFVNSLAVHGLYIEHMDEPSPLAGSYSQSAGAGGASMIPRLLVMLARCTVES